MAFDLLVFLTETLPEKNSFKSSTNEEQEQLVRELLKAVQAGKDSEAAFKLVQKLLWSFISAEYRSNASDNFKDPIIQFLIGHSLHSDGSLKKCRDITSSIAALQYIFRMVFFKHCLDQSQQTGNAIVE